MPKSEVFSDFDGAAAFKGALRFFDPDDDRWKTSWGVSYGPLMPNIRLFASDAFGVMYGLDDDDKAVIFWSETAELERLGVTEEEFYRLIKQDPDGTISYGLHVDAEKIYGRLGLDQHFAFKIELAMGGELSVKNIMVMDAVAHMNALGKLAQRIRDIPVGTKFDQVRLESTDDDE